jgi:hypothetical protein
MMTELKDTVNQDSPFEDEFYRDAIRNINRFYGPQKEVFQDLLSEGYNNISWGRSPFGFSDKKGFYIVSIFKFTDDEGRIKTLEVNKEKRCFGNYSFGVTEHNYSTKKFDKLTHRFSLHFGPDRDLNTIMSEWDNITSDIFPPYAESPVEVLP